MVDCLYSGVIRNIQILCVNRKKYLSIGHLFDQCVLVSYFRNERMLYEKNVFCNFESILLLFPQFKTQKENRIRLIERVKPLLLILMSIQKTIQQQRFVPPEVSESLPTFRQVGSYMNSIPSVSTIYLDRDNTHTRMESELKMNSNKPSVDLSNGTYSKGESDILSYSSTENFPLQDSLLIIHRLIKLLTSQQNLKRHLLHSLQISGYSCEKATEIAQTVTYSLGQYTQLASKVDIKVIRQQILSGHTKIALLNKELIKLKQQNLKGFQKNVKYQEQNKKYKDKYFQLKQKCKKSTNNQQIYQIVQNFSSQMEEKMMNLQTQLLEKMLKFQDSILLVSQFRQRMQMRKKYVRVLRPVQDYIQALAQKQNINHPIKQIQQCSKLGDSFMIKKQMDQKNEEIARLKYLIDNISQQLSDQKILYEAMLDKNISLEKEIYMLALSQGKNSSCLQKNSSGQSFCIVNQNRDLEYFREDINSNEVNTIEA